MNDLETIAAEVAKAARDAALAALAQHGVDLVASAFKDFEDFAKVFFRVQVKAHAKTLVVDDQREG